MLTALISPQPQTFFPALVILTDQQTTPPTLPAPSPYSFTFHDCFPPFTDRWAQRDTGTDAVTAGDFPLSLSHKLPTLYT
jgi:hypothetical protein